MTALWLAERLYHCNYIGGNWLERVHGADQGGSPWANGTIAWKIKTVKNIKTGTHKNGDNISKHYKGKHTQKGAHTAHDTIYMRL